MHRFRYLFLVLGIVFNVSGQLLLKRAALAGGAADETVHRSFLSLWFIGGVASHGLSMIFWVLVLRKLPLNLAHPVTIGSCLVLVAMASRLLWNEPMPASRIAGIGIIMAGVVLVAREVK